MPLLLTAGPTWNPEGTHEVNSPRCTLLECESEGTIDLLKMFRKYHACPAAQVHRLLGTPRIKDHLKLERRALLRLGIHLDAEWRGNLQGSGSRA